MENLTVLQTPQQSKGHTLEKSTATGPKHIQSEGVEIIIGLESIDRILIGLCPEIVVMSGEDIQFLRTIIIAYWLENKEVTDIIRQKTNRETVDFIEGIGLLINELELDSLTALQGYFNACTEDFNPESICVIEEIEN